MPDANFFWAKGDLLSKHKERLVHGPLLRQRAELHNLARDSPIKCMHDVMEHVGSVCARVCMCVCVCVCVCVCAFSICTALMDWWGYWLTNICWISTVFLPALDLVFLFSQQKRPKVQGNLNWIFWELWSWFLLQWHKIQVTWFFLKKSAPDLSWCWWFSFLWGPEKSGADFSKK